MINARRAARDLHTISPWSLERRCWGQFASQLGDSKKSRIKRSVGIVVGCYRHHLDHDHYRHYHHHFKLLNNPWKSLGLIDHSAITTQVLFATCV